MWEAVKFEDVSLGYGSSQSVMEGVNFSLSGGSFHYLIGPSGAGKTSLIRLIHGSIRHFGGQLTVLNHRMSEIRREELCFLRQQIGVVFQEFNLVENLSVVDNVALPLRVKGVSWRNSINRAREILSWTGFEGSFQALPESLSGGQKQRVVVARAIINEPRILLADEATGNLDDENAIRLVELFQTMNRNGTTIVFATHNHGLIRLFPHPCLLLKNRTVEKILLSGHGNNYGAFRNAI